jgi:hypothetical protein
VTGHGSSAFDISVLSSIFAEEFLQKPKVVEIDVIHQALITAPL